MWPFKNTEPKPLWTPETQAKIEASEKMGRELCGLGNGVGFGKQDPLPYSFVVFGDEQIMHGIMLGDSETHVRADAASDWFKKVGNKRINAIEVCGLDDEEVKTLKKSMRGDLCE